MLNEANKCICCSVKNCQHHCSSENYCTLKAINVGALNSKPSSCDCTECSSFKTCS